MERGRDVSDETMEKTGHEAAEMRVKRIEAVAVGAGSELETRRCM